MWTQSVMKIGQVVARGFVRWLEMLGQNPPLSRDHGLYAWQHLHAEQRRSTRDQGRRRGDRGAAGRPRLVLLPGGLTSG